MRVHNFLKNLVDCLQRWERVPELEDFAENYYWPMAELVDCAFDGPREMYSLLSDLNWESYRKEVLRLDPDREEARLRKNLRKVEELFGLQLQGEVILFGAFEAMDGYARIDQGGHRVFLGVDERHARGRYLDILEVHELTHVVRESRSEVWRGWGLDPRMTHDEFVETQPVIEHLFGEGFSGAISEILVPCDEPWHYAYQSKESLERILSNADAVDRVVHRELAAGTEADWGRLYSPTSYRPH